MSVVLRCPYCQARVLVDVLLKVLDASPLDEEVLHVNMSVRTYNVLCNANIKTVGELASYTVRDLKKIYNCGKKTISELENILKVRGLSLRGEQWPVQPKP